LTVGGGELFECLGARGGVEVPAEFAADPVHHPVLALSPIGGELRWYLDAAACPQALE